MKPQVGDIWKWCGGQHYLMLEYVGVVDYAYSLRIEKWWMLSLQDGSRQVYAFDPRHITDKSWEKVA